MQLVPLRDGQELLLPVRAEVLLHRQGRALVQLLNPAIYSLKAPGFNP